MTSEYGVAVGDRVVHIKDNQASGTVVKIDTNLPHPTTCVVRWDDGDDDTTWTNKIVRIPDGLEELTERLSRNFDEWVKNSDLYEKVPDDEREQRAAELDAFFADVLEKNKD